MPRRPRSSDAGGIHHVVNRCNHRAHLLSSQDLQDCCRLLAETKRRFGLRVFGYAFLHNHYHLIVQEPGRGVLAKAMHWFNGSAAVRYNLRHKMAGHLWQGRFKNRLLGQEDRDFISCLLYVDLNPARAGLASQITDWIYSSARAHADGVPDPLLDPPPIPLDKYRQVLEFHWSEIQQLQQALKKRDPEAARLWLRNAPSRTFIPYKQEISQLVGHNFRRIIRYRDDATCTKVPDPFSQRGGRPARWRPAWSGDRRGRCRPGRTPSRAPARCGRRAAPGSR